MKKNYFFTLIVASILTITTFISCSKEDDVSVDRAVVGSWTLTKAGIDFGNNGQIDSNELFDIPNSNINVTFRGDNTGTGATQFSYFPSAFGNGEFSWQLDGRAQTITINKIGGFVTAKFLFLDYNSFAILDPSVDIYGQYLWNVFSRN